MTINEKLAAELSINQWQVDNAVALIDEGNTIPFISRYRKEATGQLNDEVLRNLEERLNYLRNMEQKRADISVLLRNKVSLLLNLLRRLTRLKN